MLLEEKQFKDTMTARFIDKTESAENFDPIAFDKYVQENLVDELGIMNIEIIYETLDDKYRHVIFNTEIRNTKYIIVINLVNKNIVGHYVLNLNKEYGIIV